MVRHKTRWLLVRFDYEPDVVYGSQRPSTATNEAVFYGGRRDTEVRRSGIDAITRKDVFKTLQESILFNFGISASGAAQDTQVRLYDSKTRLAMIRVPREFCNLIRAAITFITIIQKNPVIVRCISVNSCARTAKMVAIKEVKKYFRNNLHRQLQEVGDTLPAEDQKLIHKECNELGELLKVIRTMD
mmetsp:Transcript_2758/g.4284  ORF Transcript_2758/g.4284 Transcript_2758/m.4284 type:complete len:187 (-) Transcript_2758:521-1081(-)|eukprot:CAMPEP_0195284556 /NCGR_PEP_ID=MMETSP0707-20130614/2717_1 /TAXON_ID=33640 /ORGANISM="Asterionellopsis glacialis, Strain CCMP134" /LENGTH=186 /DNA_ID=CAMNT_0040343915 /DNA_START=32 /DNA_END=592 /DNA_ORIENTATION=+